jgi:hypothetical protein
VSGEPEGLWGVVAPAECQSQKQGTVRDMVHCKRRGQGYTLKPWQVLGQLGVSRTRIQRRTRGVERRCGHTHPASKGESQSPWQARHARSPQTAP